MLNLSGRDLTRIPRPGERPLGRAEYVKIGLALMAVKYAVDFTLIYVLTGVFWTPIDYVLSLASLSTGKASLFSPVLSLALLLWTLPFIWIGVMLSVRRARDAGVPIWLVVLFFIPGANYVLMLTLALWPSASVVTIESLEVPVPAHAHGPGAFLAGVGAGVLTGVALGASGTLALETYALSLFAATPFVSGAVSAFVSTKLNPRSDSSTAVVLCTLCALAATCVLVAFEGVMCLAMAIPLMIPLAMLGGLLGEALAKAGAGRATIALMIAVVPGGQVVDAATATAPLREVLTSIEIAAPRKPSGATSSRSPRSIRPPRGTSGWAFRIRFARGSRALVSARLAIANSRRAHSSNPSPRGKSRRAWLSTWWSSRHRSTNGARIERSTCRTSGASSPPAAVSSNSCACRTVTHASRVAPGTPCACSPRVTGRRSPTRSSTVSTGGS